MKFDRDALLLYAVTDRSWLGENSLASQVEKVIQNGATMIQLREKELDEAAFIAEAQAVKAVTDQYHVPLIINDNIQVALAVDADGVHVGQSDTALAEARRLLGPDKIIGVSTQSVALAQAAEAGGADYIGVGAVFPTYVKKDATQLTPAILGEICAAVRIPAVAIGGIGPQNLPLLRGTGVAGVAVISAIFSKPDVGAATRELAALAREILR